jgi:hypothetical protein
VRKERGRAGTTSAGRRIRGVAAGGQPGAADESGARAVVSMR